MNIDSIFFYWEQRKLEDFGSFTGGTSIESEFEENGKYKVISIGSYSETSKYNDQGIRCRLSEKTINKILNKDDLTMILNDKTSSGNIIGRVLIIDKSGEYVYNQRTERIEPNIQKYYPQFLYHMLNAPNIRKKIIKQSQGNTQIFVNWTGIQKLEYLVPKMDEQINLAKLIGNLDNLITLHQRKFNYILSHKLEIKLFFFKITKNVWEQRKLGDISFSYSGGTPNVGNNSYYGGSIPFIRSGEIKEKHTELFLTEEGFKNSSSKMVEKGDILYALYGATSGEVSISLINGAINQAILAIRPQCPYNNYFISQWLKKEKNNITSTYLQGGQGNLSGEIVKNLEINFPKQNIEQDKIGEIFTNLDNLITLHQHKELKRRNDNNDNLRW